MNRMRSAKPPDHLFDEGHGTLNDKVGSTRLWRDGKRMTIMTKHYPGNHDVPVFIPDGVEIRGSGCSSTAFPALHQQAPSFQQELWSHDC
jgi:hypothetical protein